MVFYIMLRRFVVECSTIADRGVSGSTGESHAVLVGCAVYEFISLA